MATPYTPSTFLGRTRKIGSAFAQGFNNLKGGLNTLGTFFKDMQGKGILNSEGVRNLTGPRPTVVAPQVAYGPPAPPKLQSPAAAMTKPAVPKVASSTSPVLPVVPPASSTPFPAMETRAMLNAPSTMPMDAPLSMPAANKNTPAAPIFSPEEIERGTAEKIYQKSLEISPDELSTQEDIDKILTEAERVKQSGRLGVQATSEKAIPMEFITGQQRAIENRVSNELLGLKAQAEPLEQKMARLQARRIASTEASKFALERADKRVAEAKGEFAPTEIGAGSSLVKRNPTTGAYETIFTAPKEKAMPADQDPNRILSPTEARDLGVPYGTTAGAAYGKTSSKPLTEAQAKDLTYATRGDEAEQYIAALEQSIVGYNPVSWMAATAAENNPVGNVFVPDEIKQIRQAERNFLTAVLRRESGATISPSEFAVAEKQYFPRPGDDAQTLRQKAQSRRTAIESFRRSYDREGGDVGGAVINTSVGPINPNF